jgi:NAD(P)H dehydrogenase (quinone)
MAAPAVALTLTTARRATNRRTDVIVITGAGGHVGGLVARQLSERGIATRLVTRDPSRLPELGGAEVVRADGFEDRAAIAAALGEGDRVFMVAMHSSLEDRIRQHQAFVDTAVAAGVGQLVYLSCVNAGPEAVFLHGRSHGATETMIREAGVPFTFVRMSLWTDDIPTWFESDGAIRGPHGEGRIRFTFRPEIAGVIAATLTEDGHEGQTYNVSGPESVSMPELAAIATDVTGGDYRWEPIDRSEWEATRVAMGLPAWSVAAGLSSWDAFHAGEFDVESDTVRELAGVEPITVAGWIASHAAEMPLA